MPTLKKYLLRHKKPLFLALVLGAINQFFSLLDPQIFRMIIDRFVTNGFNYSKQEFIQGVLLLLLASVGVAFVSRVAKSFQDYFSSVVTERVGAQMYSESINHSFSLPFSVFEDQRSGELLQKLQKARTDSQGLINSFLNVIFLSLIGIIFVLIYAWTVHYSVGIMYTSIIPVLGTLTFYLSTKIKKIQKDIISQTAILAGSTTETLRNVELVKSLGLEEQEVIHLNKVNEEILELELKKVTLVRKLSFIQGTAINAIRSTLLFVMLWLIYSKIISVGEFFSLFVYSFFVFTPLTEFGNFSSKYQEAKVSIDKLDEILAMQPEQKTINLKKIDKIESISFNSLTYSYSSSEKRALDQVSIDILKGKTIAFVGPSGSGKSTAIKMLLGLYKPTSGKLLINNINSEEIDYDSLKKRIGFVAQDTQLFSGTLRENLTFVKPDATDEECLKALKDASLDSLLERSNLGLDTKIGEGGVKISGGEKQRLAIARALLRNPDIFVFDEATSSLDSMTENNISNTISELKIKYPQTMTVLIAHRLSTVINADTIYVFEKGKITEQGNHNDLLALKGLYYALWRQQSGVGV